MRFLLIFLFVLCDISVCAIGNLSPFAFGWKDANSDYQRYEILYETHKRANELGADVDYSGIQVANIAIGKTARPIPLTLCTDFKGVVFLISSCEKTSYIFELVKEHKPITVSKKDIDKGKFQKQLGKNGGKCLLSLTDDNCWGTRIGYTDKIVRKDLLLIKNGRAIDKTIMPYNNEYSSPSCVVSKIDYDSVVIKNASFVRPSLQKEQARILSLEYLNNVFIRNISIYTPIDTLWGDMAIRISNCREVKMDNVVIKGSYSKTNRYGYGIGLFNVTCFHGTGICGHAPWGVFGNMNVNKAVLENCDINRWDIHSYGKDVVMRNCRFSGLYNQYSSTYGTVLYDSCVFVNSIPYLMESSYNSYVKHKVVFKNCAVISNDEHAVLFRINQNDVTLNSRPELKKKYWPEVTILNTMVTINGKREYYKKVIKKQRFFNDDAIKRPMLTLFFNK